jgi:hypothetical protein
MPWTPGDAEKHTHKATTWALKELWMKVANECLERTGDEGRAIREANAVIARQPTSRNSQDSLLAVSPPRQPASLPKTKGLVAIWDGEPKRTSIEHDSVHDEP